MSTFSSVLASVHHLQEKAPRVLQPTTNTSVEKMKDICYISSTDLRWHINTCMEISPVAFSTTETSKGSKFVHSS